MTLDDFLAILGIVVPCLLSIYIYKKQILVKRLSYKIILKSESILARNKTKSKKWRDFFINPLPGFNFPLATIRDIVFVNNGNQPIVGEDIERPITIFFNNEEQIAGEKILKAEILACKPRNLPVAWSIDRYKITFEKFLLNRGDMFIVRIATDCQWSRSLYIETRIRDVPSLTKLGEANANLLYISILLVLPMFIYWGYRAFPHSGLPNGIEENYKRFVVGPLSYLCDLFVVYVNVLKPWLLNRRIKGLCKKYPPGSIPLN